ncbi:MAG: Ig-like domain-containing protein, partial [Bifidobacteriaceae bacterium]|jgi:alpha-tubulin suppressor-like RCC1 family protein|nr:Ig-like domain-containing protein [Bifidobacteriaceae bacterium]
VAGAFEPIESLPEIAQIAMGAGYGLLVSTGGTVFAFGDNRYGQLGIPDPYGSADPVEVPGLPSIVGVAAADFHALAVTADGKVWGWGQNDDGQTGDGSFGSVVAPGPVIGLTGIVAVAAGGGSSVAVDSAGFLHTWGYNPWGKLGDTRGQTITSPRHFLGVTNIKAIAGGDNTSVALTKDGEVYTWGHSAIGAYGAVPEGDSHVPALVKLTEPIDSLAMGSDHVVALGYSGSVYSWGQDYSGETGQGEIGASQTPAEVTIPGAESDPVVRVVAGNSVSAVITKSGKVYSWGRNDYGALGNGAGGSVSVPRLVRGLPPNDPIVDLAMTSFHSLALTQSKRVYVWGTGVAAALGRDSSRSAVYEPTEVPAPDDVKTVAAASKAAFVVTESGDAYVWGQGYHSSLGVGTTETLELPTKLDVLDGIADVAPGETQSVALSTSGYVYGTGDNYEGGLGIAGTSTVVEGFTLVPGIADVQMLTHSRLTTLALTTSGELWAWGYTSRGQTGFLPPQRVPAQSPVGFRVAFELELPERPTPGETPGGDGVPDVPGSEDSVDDGGPAVPPVSPPPAGDDTPTTAPTAPGESPVAPIPPAAPGAPDGGSPVSKVTASFITVIARAGSTVKVPVAAHVTAGSPTGTVAVAWKASAPKVATLTKGKKAGSVKVKAGSTSRLSIRTAKAGVSKITLKVPGGKDYVITVKAVAKDKVKKVAKVRIEVRGSGSTRVTPGSSVRLKAWVSPIGAVRSAALWKSSEPSVATVDRVGKVTAVGEGKAVITAIVQGKTARKTITVTSPQG